MNQPQTIHIIPSQQTIHIISQQQPSHSSQQQQPQQQLQYPHLEKSGEKIIQSIEIENHRHWQTNICDCCGSCNTCCLGFICPCIAYTKVNNHINNNSSCCSSFCKGLCCCIMPCSVFIRAPYRKKLRVKYNLPAKPCNDFCTSLFCCCCALSQELNEINYQESKPPQQTMQI